MKYLSRTLSLLANFSLTVVEPECEKSSATTYYWYREALNISSSLSESGGLNWKMTVCLLAAWVMVCLAMIKGIQSSGKVSILFTCMKFLLITLSVYSLEICRSRLSALTHSCICIISSRRILVVKH